MRKQCNRTQGEGFVEQTTPVTTETKIHVCVSNVIERTGQSLGDAAEVVIT